MKFDDDALEELYDRVTDECSPILMGEYEHDEIHDILKWINRIKAAQISLIHNMNISDLWAIKRILDNSWDKWEQEAQTKRDRWEEADFEKRFMQELMGGGHHEP